MFKEGTHVKWDDNAGCPAGTGRIRGVATTGAPVIGQTYIIRPDTPVKDYPYSHIVLFEVHLTEVDNETTLV